jgi:hypothetical protein
MFKKSRKPIEGKNKKSVLQALKFVIGHSTLLSLKNFIPIDGDKRDWAATLKYLKQLNQNKIN